MSGFHKFHEGPIITMRWQVKEDIRSRIDSGIGARKSIADILAQLNVGSRVLLVTPDSLDAMWASELSEILASRDYSVVTLDVADGDECKSIESLQKIWDVLQENCFDRHDSIVALGGGAVCDLAGFAAATYLRGINLALIPTTLLAQVDAAIGGKTAINLKSGKNLAGTFYIPQSVILDPTYLSTLPSREFVSGIGEIIKYALIEDTISSNTDYKPGPRPFLSVLQEALPQIDSDESLQEAHQLLPGIITTSVKMKLAVVGKDLHEGGLRRVLNLGHTLGHAVEKVSDYSVTHGEAVAMGLVFALKLAIKKKTIAEDLLTPVISLLEEVDLPVAIPDDLDKTKIVGALAHDKKRQSKVIKFVLPQSKLGIVDYDFEIPISELADFVLNSSN